MCYQKGYIDFTQFNSALILGKKDNNDHYSNGVGKSTIFKAIEYVLFNQAEVNLEKIIRDDANSCQIVLDFIINDQEYRLSRIRTQKGTTDLTLLQRNSIQGSVDEAYHYNEHPYLDKKDIQKFWKDLSGSRAGDTEKDLAKLIKINHKSFLSTSLFPQNDMTGLPTATPEKRKAILKEALNLGIYSKLEKIAKDEFNSLNKEIDKNKILLDSLGNPAEELITLKNSINKINDELLIKNNSLTDLNVKINDLNLHINNLTQQHSILESNFASLVVKQKTLNDDKLKIENSIQEYQLKKSNLAQNAKSLVNELNSLKEQQTKLSELQYSNIEIYQSKLDELKQQLTFQNVSVANLISDIDKLKIPLPNDAVCQHCRRAMTQEHKEDCKKQIVKDLNDKQIKLQESKKNIIQLTAEINKTNQLINSLVASKQQLELLVNKISVKEKEITDKKSLYEEYISIFNKINQQLKDKQIELLAIEEELQKSSLKESEDLKNVINLEKQKISVLNYQALVLNKESQHLTNNRAVISHSIDQKVKDELKIHELTQTLANLHDKIKIYPSVLQGFSSTGIPNLIIQNVLDDLQFESNNLLSQLKPGLQLSFAIEKTVEKTGDQADTLDITYKVNGKERYYKQLSGAQQLAVTFSLKLGLSFLLQKIIGIDVKFLLLDEIDQSLDKASVDAFADIVKFFQKDFTILIITHNDRLKDKFNHVILVEQDINMVSNAKVVSL